MVDKSKRPSRIMLVDDEQSYLEMGKLFLNKEGGLLVDTFSNCFAAREAFNNENYDGIICDFQMPEINGLDFLKDIRAEGITIPFIIFTGKGREEVAIQALNLGANRYLQKGMDTKSQYAILAEYIKQEIDHWRAGENLRKREELYRTLVETMTDGLIAINEYNSITFANNNACQILDYSKSELVGCSIFNFFNEDNLEIINRQIALRKMGETASYEITWTKKDGSSVHTILAPRALTEEGRHKGSFVVITDITKRIETERLLNAKKSRLSILYQVISAANKAETLDELFSDIIDQTLKLLNYDGGGVYLVDFMKRTAELSYHKHLPEEFIKEVKSMKIDQKPYCNIFIDGHSLIVEEYSKLFPNRLTYGIKSIASFPLFFKEKVIGAINVASFKRSKFSDLELEILEAIGKEAGSAANWLLMNKRS
ncbi:MAG: response regulator [Candidatus Kariarchaeaceae archaeon]